MPWSPAQRSMFLAACGIAGLNDRQRYLIMAHAGCPMQGPSPVADGGGAAKRSTAAAGASSAARPSVKHPGNTHEQFAACMAIVEAQAAYTRGGALPDNFPRPARGPSGGTRWADAERHMCERLRHRIRAMFDAAMRDVPSKFNARSLDGFCERMTALDTRHTGDPRCGVPVLNVIKPRTLDHLDAGQLYRVLEGAKAWIAREYRARDLRVPFTVAPGIARRSSAPESPCPNPQAPSLAFSTSS